jgi:leucyl-tRNA synthetase
MVLNEAFSRTSEAKRLYFWEHELNIERDQNQKVVAVSAKADGQPVTYEGWTTMSKSKNNGVDPQKLVNEFGADTARLFMMFAAPPELSLEWSDDGVQGAHRFMKRLWKAVYEHATGTMSGDGNDSARRDLRRLAHQTLAKVTDDYGRRRVFNTAIAAVMELINALGKFNDQSKQGRAVVQETLELIVIMLSPIVPHACHQLWKELGHTNALIDESWPKPDPAALVQDSIELVVQVNGKLRGRVTVPSAASKEQIEVAALADDNVQKWLDGKPPKKVIVVPGKLVNVVI